ELPALSKQQIRAAGAARCHCRPGRGVVHGAVLRPVLPADHAEAGYALTYLLIGLSLLIGTPFFILFGRLSDRIGRLKIILAGCLMAALTYFPLFQALTHYVNPDLEAFQQKNPITVTADQSSCHLHI